MARFLAVVALSAHLVTSQPNIDGGRGDLPGMKQDMFDQVKRQKKGGPQSRMGKAPPECPKVGIGKELSPFASMALVGGEMYIRINASEGPCQRLISVGGANLTVLRNASLTCGPVGEWKKRLAEDMNMVFFQGGLEWVKSENETIEVITEEGTFEVEVTEQKYAQLSECWARSCGCEQANNPKMKIILFSLLLCAIGGLGYDSFKLAWESFRGKGKPSKHVLCKKGHKMTEVKMAYSHICDICRKTGTEYQCSVSCNYDMCRLCYKAAKKKTRAELKAWLEKHPEDADNNKSSKSKEDDDEDEDAKKGSESESVDKKDSKAQSEGESDAQAEGSEAEKEATGDEKAKSEEEKEESKIKEKMDELQ